VRRPSPRSPATWGCPNGYSSAGAMNCASSRSRHFPAKAIRASWRKRTGASSTSWSGSSRRARSYKKRSVSSRAPSPEGRLPGCPSQHVRRCPSQHVRRLGHVPCPGRFGERLLCLAPPRSQSACAGRRRLDGAPPDALCRWPRGVGQSAYSRRAAPPRHLLRPQTGRPSHAGAGPVCHVSAPAQATYD
jgi:hypothetical protein